jgi:L-threonylcarbamoyladenylate synthase
VAFPTETVYGLGAEAMREDAVARVFAAKARPADNPLIVHVTAPETARPVVAGWTPLADALARAYWPGPVTLVLEANPDVPAITRGGLTTVAVRVPDHPVAQALLAAFDRPVAAPSANRSGRPSPTTAGHVADDLAAEVALVVDGGACELGVESTVVDARGSRPVVLREGSVSREDLGIAPGTPETGRPVDAELAASPGTRYRHYAPACEVVVAAPGEASSQAAALRDAGRRVGLVARGAPPPGVVELARFADAADLARHLYAALRDGERRVEVIVVEAVPEAGVGRAVMDRLRRAAEGT